MGVVVIVIDHRRLQLPRVRPSPEERIYDHGLLFMLALLVASRCGSPGEIEAHHQALEVRACQGARQGES